MNGSVSLDIVERIDFAGGREFGAAGAYERLVARARYAVDPSHPANREIVDIDFAPVGADGLVRFSGDVEILRPHDPARGNRRGFFEFVNRGNRRTLQFFCGARQTNDPRSDEDAGDGFMLDRGYTLIWAGWQGDNLPGNGRLLLDLPVAEENGKPLTGRITAEFFVDKGPVYSLPISGYVSTRSNPAASLDTRRARLTRRRYPDSERILIPDGEWAFARYHGQGAPTTLIVETGLAEDQAIIPSPSDIFLKDGFRPGWLYELVYEAERPLVLGLGHAAVRDLVSFLRNDRGPGNPLHSPDAPLEKVYAWGRSQTGRCVRDFIYRGFNADLDGRRVFDGMLSHIAGAGRLDLNRFSNLVISSSRAWEHHYNPADRFPFSYARCTDHLTGREDAILKRPETDPLVIHTHTASEYWYRRASLVHTDTLGNDLEQPDNVRIYHWSSSQHWANPMLGPPSRGAGVHFVNNVQTFLLFRPLVDMMDAWASKGTPPPPSRYPRREDGSLVTYDEWKAQFPQIPGAHLPAGPNGLEQLDFGPRADQGVLDTLPPTVGPGRYVVLVPAVDEDGNEIAGVRAPMVQAPLGAYTGWNVRARGHGYGATYNFVGSYIPLPDTEDERRMLRDPRLSVEARYGSPEGYTTAITAGALALVQEGFMLAEDVKQAADESRNWNSPRHDVRL